MSPTLPSRWKPGSHPRLIAVTSSPQHILCPLSHMNLLPGHLRLHVSPVPCGPHHSPFSALTPDASRPAVGFPQRPPHAASVLILPALTVSSAPAFASVAKLFLLGHQCPTVQLPPVCSLPPATLRVQLLAASPVPPSAFSALLFRGDCRCPRCPRPTCLWRCSPALRGSQGTW